MFIDKSISDSSSEDESDSRMFEFSITKPKSIMKHFASSDSNKVKSDISTTCCASTQPSASTRPSASFTSSHTDNQKQNVESIDKSSDPQTSSEAYANQLLLSIMSPKEETKVISNYNKASQMFELTDEFCNGITDNDEMKMNEDSSVVPPAGVERKIVEEEENVEKEIELTDSSGDDNNNKSLLVMPDAVELSDGDSTDTDHSDNDSSSSSSRSSSDLSAISGKNMESVVSSVVATAVVPDVVSSLPLNSNPISNSHSKRVATIPMPPKPSSSNVIKPMSCSSTASSGLKNVPGSTASLLRDVMYPRAETHDFYRIICSFIIHKPIKTDIKDSSKSCSIRHTSQSPNSSSSKVQLVPYYDLSKMFHVNHSNKPKNLSVDSGGNASYLSTSEYASFHSYYQYMMMMIVEECRSGVNGFADVTTGTLSIESIVYTESQAQYLPMYMTPLLFSCQSEDESVLAKKRCKLCTILVNITQSHSDAGARCNSSNSDKAPVSVWNLSNSFISLQSGDLVMLSRTDWAGSGATGFTNRNGHILGVVLGWDPDFYEYGMGMQQDVSSTAVTGGSAYIMICVEEEDTSGYYMNRRGSRTDSMSDMTEEENPGNSNGKTDASLSPWIPKYLVAPGSVCDVTVVGNVLTSLREIQSIAALSVVSGYQQLTPAQHMQHLKQPNNYFNPQQGVKLTQLQRLLYAPNQFLQQLSSKPVVTPTVHDQSRNLVDARDKHNSNSAVAERPRNVPMLLWKRLSRSYNISQLNAICSICGDRLGCSSANSSHVLESLVENKLNGVRLTLLQGPPGTGKTETIVGIVSVLLAAGCYPRIGAGQLSSEKKTKIKVGSSLTQTNTSSNSNLLLYAQQYNQPKNQQQRSKPSHNSGNGSSSSPSDSDKELLVNDKGKCRILICAPSNVAIDEIIVRLKTEGVFRADGTRGGRDINIVRIGQPGGRGLHNRGSDSLRQLYNPDASSSAIAILESCTLDNLVEKRRTPLRGSHYGSGSGGYRSGGAAYSGPEDGSDAGVGIRGSNFSQTNFKKNNGSQNSSNSSSTTGISRVSGENVIDIRRRILLDADVVCSTLSGAASSAILDVVLSHGVPASGISNASFRFDAIIIDESCQSVEPSTLIPFKYVNNFTPKPTDTIMVLIGDPCQLSSTIMSTECKNKYQYDKGLFERLYEAGYPVHILDTQYRMHPSIAEYPSQKFYKNEIRTADAVKKLTDESIRQYKHSNNWVPSNSYTNTLSRDVCYHHDRSNLFKPLLFHDLVYSKQEAVERSYAANYSDARSSNSSLRNLEEVNYIMKLYSTFRSKYPQFCKNIGIIVPYRAQLTAMIEAFRSKYGRHFLSSAGVEISTVDGFQGREKNIIIFSCVRTSNMTTSSSVDVGSSSGRVSEYADPELDSTKRKRSSSNLCELDVKSITVPVKSIGFLNEWKRLNTAITRAKYALWIVGQKSALELDSEWKAYIDYLVQKSCYIERARLEHHSMLSDVILGTEMRMNVPSSKHRSDNSYYYSSGYDKKFDRTNREDDAYSNDSRISEFRDHKSGSGRADMLEKCYYFSRTGVCNNGDRCRFAHVDNRAPHPAVSTRPEHNSKYGGYRNYY